MLSRHNLMQFQPRHSSKFDSYIRVYYAHTIISRHTQFSAHPNCAKQHTLNEHRLIADNQILRHDFPTSRFTTIDQIRHERRRHSSNLGSVELVDGTFNTMVGRVELGSCHLPLLHDHARNSHGSDNAKPVRSEILSIQKSSRMCFQEIN